MPPRRRVGGRRRRDHGGRASNTSGGRGPVSSGVGGDRVRLRDARSLPARRRRRGSRAADRRRRRRERAPHATYPAAVGIAVGRERRQLRTPARGPGALMEIHAPEGPVLTLKQSVVPLAIVTAGVLIAL